MIGIDLGGTRIKGVVIDQNGNILHQTNRPTNDGAGAAVWKNAVRETVHDLMNMAGLDRSTVGISAPGLANADFTAIADMPGRMEGLEHFFWEKHLGQPTAVLNDGIAATLAEARFGAAKGRKNAVLLTLGTGVGGGIIIDGRPYGGTVNKAGHFAHMVVNCDGEPDVTGMPGSLEACIGNCTVEKRSGGRFKSTRDLVFAHKNGDAAATKIWLRSVWQLGLAVASISNFLSPEVVVIGGGVAEAGDALFVPLREFVGKHEWQPGGVRVEIVKAAFGDIAGAIGAACFAAEKFGNT